MTKKEIFNIICEKEKKYCDLVWYARSSTENDNVKGVVESRRKVEESYPEEIKSFQEGDNPDWDHGFNSGMLAAIRYIIWLEEYGKVVADQSFPFLDT